MSIQLTPEERETSMNVNDGTMQYNIYTCQRRMITEMTNKGHTPYWCEKDGDRIVAAIYTIPYRGISIRSYKSIYSNSKREISEERKEQMRENLAKARQNSKK